MGILTKAIAKAHARKELPCCFRLKVILTILFNGNSIL